MRKHCCQELESRKATCYHCSRSDHPNLTNPPCSLTLTPSEPACRAWPPPLRPPATLLKLPLRSPPARTGTLKYAGPTVVPVNKTTVPVLWRPLAYLQRLPQHPDLLRGCRGPQGATSLGWAWLAACSGTCRPNTAFLNPGQPRRSYTWRGSSVEAILPPSALLSPVT